MKQNTSEQLNNTKLIIELPYIVIKILRNEEKAGFVNFNQFIELSITDLLETSSTNFDTNLNLSNRIPVAIQISGQTAFRLGGHALLTNNSVSDIVSEVLGYSIPVLLDELQAQEDYRLEVETLE